MGIPVRLHSLQVKSHWALCIYDLMNTHCVGCVRARILTCSKYQKKWLQLLFNS